MAFAFTFPISIFFIGYSHFNIADEGTCSFTVYIDAGFMITVFRLLTVTTYYDDHATVSVYSN